MGRFIGLVCSCALLFSGAAVCQESRGSIMGRVTDSSGGVIAGASVTVTNTATNERRRLTTNETGLYEASYLEPSTYNVEAEANGFKRGVHNGLTVNVSARLEINIVLQVGAVSDSIEVTAETPLLETTSASGGRVLDQRQIVNLPFSDMNPFALSALAPGMQWTGTPEYRRPFDNGGTSAFNTSGGVGQNEYTIDGMTVTGSGRRVGFTPAADAVSEFKLETSNFDASQGFTSGAAINVVSKSGTNKFSGSLFNQHWQQRWNATPHFNRILWNESVANGDISKDTPKQDSGRSNNYGVHASGPVWIPKLINGKDKLFWTVTWNGIRQKKSETTSSKNVTVPTMAMRQGDFSELLPVDPAKYTIYDPRSARLENGVVVRTPFPGNKGVPILNPMAKYYINLFPQPNNVPGLVRSDTQDNYLAANMPKDEIFDSIVNRYDWIISERHRVNGRWQWNKRNADEYDWMYETARGMQKEGLIRANKGGNVNWLWTINSSNIVDVNYGISRFEEGQNNPVTTAVCPTAVGLPAYLDQRAGDNCTLPRLDFDDNGLNDVGRGYPVIGSIITNHEARVGFHTMKGAHSFKYGWQERRHFWAGRGPGYSASQYQFRNNWTRAADNDNRSAQIGHEWAAFLMGLPSYMAIDTNDSVYYTTPRRAFYFQDDWRIDSRFRLSFGLRYEAEGGTSERYDRAVTRVLDPNIAQPFGADAIAAYAKSPVPELPASAFNPNGGTSYFGSEKYPTGTKGTHILLPKLGFVYSVNSKTVIRAGWGMYMDTYNVSNDRFDTNGFSQATSTPISNDNGLTFCCGAGSASGLTPTSNPIVDPFPVRADGTRFNEPLGSRLGAVARTGGGMDVRPWNYRPDLQHRWRFGFQRELARNLMLDVSYNGAYSYITRNMRINYLPGQYWSTGMVRNQANDDFLNKTFPNPFRITNLTELQQSDPEMYAYLASQSFFTGSTRRRHELLRAFPQYSGTLQGSRPGQDWRDNQGYVKYRDLQILVERRFTRGFTSSFMWTMARSDVADWLANEFDTDWTERINNNTMPHRIAWTATYELPWGRGRSRLKEGFISHIIGNWNTGWVYQYQTGTATNDWGNRFFYGGVDKLKDVVSTSGRKGDMHEWFTVPVWTGPGAPPADFVGFEGRTSYQPGTYHVRMFPIRTDAIRNDGVSNLDLKIDRRFPINVERGIEARFSVDLLNAINHTNFGGPNLDPTNAKDFGRVTAQRGMSRVIQANLRFEF